MAALIHLGENGHEYTATGLLRQMCEELIFAAFLRTLDRADADEFIRLKAELELVEGIDAQETFFTRQQEVYGEEDASGESAVRMPQWGAARREEVISLLKEMGRRIGWGNKPKPTVKHMAKRAGMEDVYAFFYHASCSSVHASLHHMLRMVWRDRESGAYSITNRNFAQYYRRFSLLYGAWIASQVIHLAMEEYAIELTTEQDRMFCVWLALLIIPAIKQRAPGIVTSQELRWP